MPKFDPSFLPAVQDRRETKVFTAKGGQEFSLTVSVSDAGEVYYAITDKVEEILEKWGEAGPSAPGSPPIKVSQTLAYMIARLLVMQVPGEGESPDDLWQFTHWATLAQRDRAAFTAVNVWVNALLVGDADSPNSDAATSND